MKKILAYILSTLGIISVIYSTSFPANAAAINPHGYARQVVNLSTLTGGKVTLNTGQEDLSSNWSSTNTSSFITKELWNVFNSNEWIEIGQVKGGVNNNYWNGHYQAVKRYSSTCGCVQYSEYTLGSAGPTGSHDYKIEYGGVSAQGYDYWNVYLDGSNIDYWTIPYKKAVAVQIGIETNDSGNTFTTGTKASNAKYFESGYTTTWPSATNLDSNDLNWSSSFSYTGGGSPTNTITFSTGTGGV